jgi:cell division protein FtsB
MAQRAAAQAQVKAVRKEGVRDRTRLEKRLAASDEALATALRELTIGNLREAGMERASERPRQEIDRLVRENQALREENAWLKGSRPEWPQGRGTSDPGPPVRPRRRLITLEDDDAAV